MKLHKIGFRKYIMEVCYTDKKIVEDIQKELTRLFPRIKFLIIND